LTPAKVDLIEPAPRQFKRKAAAPDNPIAGLQGAWQTVDINIDFSTLVITLTGSSTVTVLCSFRHGAFFNPPTGEISAPATFDASAKALSVAQIVFPFLPGQHGPLSGPDFHDLKINLIDNGTGTGIIVTDTITHRTKPPRTVTAQFTRG
jgi:hypothetical protein